MRKKLAILFTFVLIIGLSVAGASMSSKTYAKQAQMHLVIPDAVQKENEFTVEVTLDSDVNLYSVDAYLAYNEEMLEFIPDNDKVTGTAGVLEIKDTYETETKVKTYRLTFKALETGQAEIAFTEVYLIDYADMDYIDVPPSAGTVNIEINRAEDSDARLTDLLVAPGDLNVPFSPDWFEYEVHVGLETETVGISAIPMEEDSDVEMDMPEMLQIGENRIVITVTAVSGNVKTYVIKVYREEIQDTSEEPDGEAGEETEETVSEDILPEASAQMPSTEAVTTEEVTEEPIENTEPDGEKSDEESDEP
ncbi:MAG: cadherin-like beta sandwich domain-containing protein [Bacteroidales bacterium]|nr:cadherin-like beta sandwich domain-containing protein [Clostridium sp.]MCM1204425.1 cadherin-like beta sandwich domain-containing protein [Bacteroidales bacterium]